MNNYVERIKGLASLLQKHPFVKQVDLKLNTGATNDQIKAAEKKSNVELDEGFKSFYSRVNGFQLSVEWRQEEMNKTESISDFEIQYPEDEENPYLSIHFRGLEEIFFEPFYNFSDDSSQILFDQQNFLLNDLAFRIRPFDIYSGFSCVAIFFTSDNRTKFLMLDGHYDDWRNSVFVDFDTYMELILKTGGICDARKRYMHLSNRKSLTRDDIIAEVSTPDFFSNFIL